MFVPDLYGTASHAAAIANSQKRITQIIANAGWGKSTLLAAVADELTANETPYEFHYLPPALFSRVPVPPRDVAVLIIDEVERLTRANLRSLNRWTEKGRRLVVSTHRNVFASIPDETQTIELPGISVDGLRRYFQSRVEWAGGDQARFVLSEDAATWLIELTGRNLRVIEAVLYEVFQKADANEQLIIERQHVKPFADFAGDRAGQEAEGNQKPSPFRRLRWALTSLSERTGGPRPGQTSRPDQRGPGHSR